ncbi:hypothetical protein EVAR_101369_1 [Eumeta japonica]|uniref:Uncharacterized protein n=1 Tax=Eumeta variegata TaxID=151549 RepID=A0A4C1TTI1_EUMVA|nr:hypothetical protein EVAR_101369_1 [Eumeta japonica]
MYSAWKGHGAFLNGEPIQVSKNCTSVNKNAVVGYEVSLIHAPAVRDKTLNDFANWLQMERKPTHSLMMRHVMALRAQGPGLEAHLNVVGSTLRHRLLLWDAMRWSTMRWSTMAVDHDPWAVPLAARLVEHAG